MILLDEPFNAIDSSTIQHLMDLICDWHKEGRTILAVLHDLDLIRAYFPETILLARELVAGGPTAEVLTPDHLHLAQRLSEELEAQTMICNKG